jgi:hypothetical protein
MSPELIAQPHYSICPNGAHQQQLRCALEPTSGITPEPSEIKRQPERGRNPSKRRSTGHRTSPKPQQGTQIQTPDPGNSDRDGSHTHLPSPTTRGRRRRPPGAGRSWSACTRRPPPPRRGAASPPPPWAWRWSSAGPAWRSSCAPHSAPRSPFSGTRSHRTGLVQVERVRDRDSRGGGGREPDADE